jgi:ParB family chromosome partitioning protein
MPKKTGLGQGLDALFEQNAQEDLGSAAAVKLRISDIEPNKDQPRKTFDQGALEELADSISKNGVLQPLLVRPMTDGTYQLVAGERRWRASRMAGLTEVPVVIREMSDDQAMTFALIENLQREDLNPIEEAEGLRLLMDECDLTQEQAAEKVGRSRPAVANSLRLLNLPDEVKELARKEQISAGHARALLAITDPVVAAKAAEDAAKGKLTVRDIEKLAKKQNREKKTQSPVSRDTFYDEVEAALTQKLGRKVTVFSTGQKKTIEFEYFSKEDLKDLANMIAKD